MFRKSLENKEIKYIAVEGVIGAGKTSLAKKLSERLNAQLILEEFDDNPFLKNFYDDPAKFGFYAQMYFILKRYKQLQELSQETLFHEYTVADYIFEKDRIFAYLNLNDEDLKVYELLANHIQKNIVVPDLIIYLQSTPERLYANIKHRDREEERPMTQEYLEKLNEAYNYFFFRYKSSKVMIVNSTEIDFVNNNDDFENLIAEILKPAHSSMEYYDPVQKRIAK
jgi:deoxyguanosine kinase